MGIMVRSISLACFVWLVVASMSYAGVYATTSDGSLPTFAIVHPPGFDGTGGVLTIAVCTMDSTLNTPVQNALSTWNALSPITGNCSMCKRVEDISPDPPFGQNIESVILHEFGHVLGLDHRNFLLGLASTSATNGFRTMSVDIGMDGVLGSSDDRHLPGPPNPMPASIIHWFRRPDNNPIVVDSLVIDESTFTRTRGFLPSGHIWPASANSDYRMSGDDVSDLLGFPNTQAVMFEFQNEQQVYSGINADDANTIRMGMTGVDKDASTSADNYTFDLVFEPNCTLADIDVGFVDPFLDLDLQPGQLAVSVVRLGEIPEPPAQTQHFFIRRPMSELRIRMKLNDNLTWDIRGGVLADGFETGDFSDWSAFVG